jgi:hypothetical protein
MNPRAAVLVAALANAAAGAAGPTIETQTMNFPNYESVQDSPQLPAGQPGLKVSFAHQANHTVFPAQGPWPLFGAYRVAGPALTELGSDIETQLVLLVTHKETRGIYTGRAIKDDPPPKQVPDAAPKGGQVLEVGGYFNVDLKAQCRIPPRAGNYWVLVQLGTLVSPVLEFEVR